MKETFYWFDYETFGIDPALDRPSQFAGLRTTMDLQPIKDEEPLVIYNRLTDDYLPDPDACRITGISPDTVKGDGLIEAEFIRKIIAEIGRTGTCHVGYNSIRFDDEFTRYTLYRNFYDPYGHEWRNRNSRWDMLDIVRLTRALRPEGIEWPKNEDGNASNRLENLTVANGIEHTQAHDALSDVRATLAVARLIRDRQPKLFDFVLRSKNKESCRELLNLREPRPVIHVSGKIPSRFHHLAMVVPLVKHPTNSNGVITLNLHYSPSELLQLAHQGEEGIEAIRTRLFTRNDDLPAGMKRLPLKTIHLNRTPVLVPLTVLKDEDAERLEIDKQRCFSNFDELQALSKADSKQLQQSVAEAMKRQEFGQPVNDDAALYGGGFTADSDSLIFEKIRHAEPAGLAAFAKKEFKDPRAQNRLFRYRARNFPDTLTKKEKEFWQQHCREQLQSDGAGKHKATFTRTISSYREKLEPELWKDLQGQPEQEHLRQSLVNYADELETRLQLNSAAVKS